MPGRCRADVRLTPLLARRDPGSLPALPPDDDQWMMRAA
jgi:hypothetical protein